MRCQIRRRPCERQVFVINLDEARGLRDQLALPARGDGLGLGTQLGRDALHNAVDHADETVIQPGGDAAHRVRPDQFFGLAEIHHRQARRLGEQAGDRHPDAGADHAAQEFLVLRDDVEVDGGAQIDHDAGAAVLRETRDGIHQAVRAHFARVVVAHGDSEIGRVIHEQRLAVEVTLGHRLQRLIDGRNHARNDHVLHGRQIQLREREQVADQNAPLVGGLLLDGAQPPAADDVFAVEGADGHVRIADIESKQHV